VTYVHKMRGWLRRYGPAEVVGTLTAILGYLLVRAVTKSETAAAYGGTLGDLVGFYGTVGTRELAHEFRSRARADVADNAPRLWAGLHRAAARIAFEFGPAELLDSTVWRPIAMGVAASRFGPVWGVPVGKLAADAVFYTVAICSYELRRYLARASVTDTTASAVEPES